MLVYRTLNLGITFPNMCVPHLPANVGGDLDNLAGSPALPSNLLEWGAWRRSWPGWGPPFRQGWRWLCSSHRRSLLPGDSTRNLQNFLEGGGILFLYIYLAGMELDQGRRNLQSLFRESCLTNRCWLFEFLNIKSHLEIRDWKNPLDWVYIFF